MTPHNKTLELVDLPVVITQAYRDKLDITDHFVYHTMRLLDGEPYRCKLNHIQGGVYFIVKALMLDTDGDVCGSGCFFDNVGEGKQFVDISLAELAQWFNSVTGNV